VAAGEAAAGTSLASAQFASTGLASLSADMRDQVWRDFAVYGAVAIFGVLLVLIVLLRSIAAPVFMVAVVTLSFAAAAGVSVLVWQHLIGIDIDWSVFPVSFMALIAVGADYSMLFAARIRDESADGMRRGILRSFGSTGSVITTAGVVFALTMFALMSGRVINLLQIGFTVGVGLLIDITLVRTILVPAAMSLIGDRIWWPNKARRG
jgi:RND superfamily putative drug exporter